MHKTIETPAILLDLNVLEGNICNFHTAAKKSGKEIWPMLKTHKSTKIAQMQHKHAASGFLCGTLDECEMLERTLEDISIMYAYPVASEPNLGRVISLAKSKRCRFYIRIDNHAHAEILNQAAKMADVQINYTLIVNSGLNRFGIEVRDVESFMSKMAIYTNLNFMGISTHSGHAYIMEPEDVSASDKMARVAIAAKQEMAIMKEAQQALTNMGLEPKLITSGSTPTYMHTVNADGIDILHPGNYVFMDYMQMDLGCAKEKDCALTVLATVISAKQNNEYIIDAGSKCFGDQAVHGSKSIEGYGYIKNHPGLVLYSLSEEVGKIRGSGGSQLYVGQKIEIIPNHSCSTANMTSWYVCTRDGVVDEMLPKIEVDMRSNLTAKSKVRACCHYGNVTIFEAILR